MSTSEQVRQSALGALGWTKTGTGHLIMSFCNLSRSWYAVSHASHQCDDRMAATIVRTVARLSRRKSKPSSLLVTYVTSLPYAARLSASYAAASHGLDACPTTGDSVNAATTQRIEPQLTLRRHLLR